jgi:hypothetical protein
MVAYMGSDITGIDDQGAKPAFSTFIVHGLCPGIAWTYPRDARGIIHGQ